MVEKVIVVVCALSTLCVAGCGSSDGNAAASPVCPSGPGTILFTIADVSPAAGATVPNHAIVEKFTIKNAPALVKSFSTALLASHTAGVPTPPNGTISAVEVGADLLYSSTVDAWTTAPGHVETAFSGRYTTSDGCIWGFPSPMFSYDVVPAGTSGDAGAD
jgi:hypothetical protein